MNIFRITIVSLPLLVVSNVAFADSEEKKKSGAIEPEAPAEAPKAEVEEPIVPPPAVQQPAPSPPAPPPTVGTTQTTSTLVEETRDTAETKMEEPVRSRINDRWSLEPLVGYGTANFNFGVGGRIGYTFKVPVYLGGTFMWHAGETNNTVSSIGATETKSNLYYPAVEIGYDIGIGKRGSVMVRPYGGAAILYERERVSVNGVAVLNDTSNAGLLYPGLTARFNVPGSPWFLGGDTRLLIPLEKRAVSYQAFFVTGLSL